MPATDIDTVLQVLTGIIASCRAARDPLGYFAALYRQVTQRVKDAIVAGVFDDGPRLSRFDAAFANRYLAAYEGFRTGGTISKCWDVAFRRTQSQDLIILQDLLVGINAHINFDLGVAAADTFPDSLPAFRRDFDRINDILAATLPQVEGTVGRFSPLLDTLAKLGGKPAMETLEFSMVAARTDAWLHATLLAALPASVRPSAERALDDKAGFLGEVIARPRWPVADAVGLIKETESGDIVAIIDALASV